MVILPSSQFILKERIPFQHNCLIRLMFMASFQLPVKYPQLPVHLIGKI